MKSIRILFSLFLLWNINSWAQDPVINPHFEKRILHATDFEMPIKMLSPVAQKAKRKGVHPGAFKNISYTYSDKVIALNSSQKLQLKKSIDKSPILKPVSIKQMGLESDKIYIENGSDLVFQPKALSKDTLILIKPKMHEVFDQLIIPDQEVPITLANTSYTLAGTHVTDRDEGADYDMKMEFNNSLYEYEKETNIKGKKTKVKIKVTLNGFIGFNEPRIEAKLTKWDGYKLVFKTAEHAELSLTSNVEFSQEISIPIWGYTIPIGNIGECKVGIFAVLDVNGNIKFEAHLMQHIGLEAGVKGKTVYYIPRNYKVIKDMNAYSNVGYSLKAEIKAFGGVECIAEMKIKGYDLLRLTVRGGAEIEVKADALEKNLEAKIGLRIKMHGKIKSLDKDFDIFDKYFLLWELKEKNYGGYIFNIQEADAYYDRVWGSILKKEDSTGYSGGLKLIVKHTDNTENYYNTTTDEKGIFALSNIPLVKGDKVRVKIASSPNDSPEVDATLPFTEIRLYYADYFADKIEGSISSKIDWFAKPEEQVVNQAISGVSNSVLNKIKKTEKLGEKGVLKPNNLVKNPARLKEIFKKAITYEGDIEVIKERTYHKVKLQIPKIGDQGAPKKKSRIGTYDKKLITNPLLIQKKRVTNLPFGNYIVEGVDIKPYEKVKVRIRIDGFVLESNWVTSDGLVIMPSVDIKLRGGIYTSTISAENSMVFVSALRSDRAPIGSIKLLKGIDMKHHSIPKKLPNQPITFQKLKEFKMAKHPLIFYNKIVNLTPLSDTMLEDSVKDVGKGVAVGFTGNWKINNPYGDYKDKLSISRLDGHFFEYIGYTFQNENLFYKYYQEKCAACNNADFNSIKKLQKPSDFKNPVHVKPRGF